MTLNNIMHFVNWKINKFFVIILLYCVCVGLAQEASLESRVILDGRQAGMIGHEGAILKIEEDSLTFTNEFVIESIALNELEVDTGDFTVLGIVDIDSIPACGWVCDNAMLPAQLKPYVLSIPAPADLPVETPIIIAMELSAVTRQGRVERLHIRDTAKVVDGRIVSQDKDFWGITGKGRMVFLYLPPDSSTSTTVPPYATTIGYVEGTILYEGNPQEGVHITSDTSPFAVESGYSDGFYRMVVPLGKPFTLTAYHINGRGWGAEIGRGGFSYRSGDSIPVMSPLDISLK